MGGAITLGILVFWDYYTPFQPILHRRQHILSAFIVHRRE